MDENKLVGKNIDEKKLFWIMLEEMADIRNYKKKL